MQPQPAHQVLAPASTRGATPTRDRGVGGKCSSSSVSGARLLELCTSRHVQVLPSLLHDRILAASTRAARRLELPQDRRQGNASAGAHAGVGGGSHAFVSDAGDDDERSAFVVLVSTAAAHRSRELGAAPFDCPAGTGAATAVGRQRTAAPPSGSGRPAVQLIGLGSSCTPKPTPKPQCWRPRAHTAQNFELKYCTVQASCWEWPSLLLYLRPLLGVSWPLPPEVLSSQGGKEDEDERFEDDVPLAGQLGHGSAHHCREFLKHYGPVLTLLGSSASGALAP